MLGRIPKPAAINDLKGDTHGRRKKNQEPIPPTGRPHCPDYLGLIAKAEWQNICDQLDKMSLLSTADRAALELYCQAYERYRDAEAKVRQFGEVIISPAQKFPMVSPYAVAMNRNLDVCRRLLIEFGLTPAARARVATTPQDKATDGWAGILKFG